MSWLLLTLYFHIRFSFNMLKCSPFDFEAFWRLLLLHVICIVLLYMMYIVVWDILADFLWILCRMYSWYSVPSSNPGLLLYDLLNYWHSEIVLHIYALYSILFRKLSCLWNTDTDLSYLWEPTGCEWYYKSRTVF